MTQEALKLALEALEKSWNPVIPSAERETNAKESIAAIKEALAQPEQELTCPECKAAVLYECVACSSNNYPPAAQPMPESSACCHACFKASGAILMTRMILCPTCGNKRCPRASDHRLECTDINEPGQTGSVYTALLPVQEPVACARCKDLEEQAYDLLGQLKVANLKWSVAHPWVGLTNDEVNNFSAGCHLGKSVQGAIYEAEAKLKEKNT